MFPLRPVLLSSGHGWGNADHLAFGFDVNPVDACDVEPFVKACEAEVTRFAGLSLAKLAELRWQDRARERARVEAV